MPDRQRERLGFQELAKGSSDPQHVEKLASIKAKALLLWGDKDAMFRKTDQDALLKAIPGPS